MTAQVSYSIETTYDEYADLAQLVVKRFIMLRGGLFAPCSEDPSFVGILISGVITPNSALQPKASTRFGFILPTDMDVELFRSEPSDDLSMSLIASNGAELSDHVVRSLNWAESLIRSFEGRGIFAGTCGDTPNPDPDAASIVIHACRQWAEESELDLDDELIRLLDDEDS